MYRQEPFCARRGRGQEAAGGEEVVVRCPWGAALFQHPPSGGRGEGRWRLGRGVVGLGGSDWVGCGKFGFCGRGEAPYSPYFA